MSIINGSSPSKPSALLLLQDGASPSPLFSAPVKSVAVAFSSIGEIFRSNTSLDNEVQHHSIELLENEAEFSNTEKADKRSLVKLIFTCLAIAAALGLIKYVRNLTAADEAMDEAMEPQDASSENALATAIAVTTAQVGRRLLSSAIQSLLPNLVATEEVPFSSQQTIWDIFRNTDGSQISISAKQTNGQPLPSGMSVINQPMSLVSSTLLRNDGVSSIAYSNNYAFLGTSAGLSVFDVSNPLSPRMVSGINMNYLNILDLVDTHCYAWGLGEAITVIDISDPLNPVIASSGFLPGMRVTALKTSGNFTYAVGEIFIGSGYLSFLKILDSSDPRNLTVVGSLSLPSANSSGAPATSLTLNKNHTYCYVGIYYGGFYSIDVRNPSNPILLGTLNTEEVASVAASNDDNIFFAGTLNGIQIIDVTNSSQPIINGTFSNGGVNGMKTAGNYLFANIYDNRPSVKKYDITNPRKPILVSSVPFQATRLAISPTNVLLIDSSVINPNLAISTLGDSFSLIGTPNAATQGNYSIGLTATSSGGRVTKTFNLEINPAITIKAEIPPQKAVIGSNFNYFVQAFNQVNNAPLTYTATLINGAPLPSWLNLNPLSSTLSGIPTSADSGILTLKVTAQDVAGASAFTTCQITVLNGPTLNSPIPNQVTTIGNPYNFTMNANAFIDRDGYPLTYAATKNGEALPNWLTFDPSTQTFSGVPSLLDGGVVPITVTAQDPTNTTMTTNFQINIVTELPPTLLSPISNQVATVGKAFKFAIPANTFADTFADEITYTVHSSDGASFPAWLSYDPTSRTFSGTPSYGDTNSFADRVLQITLSAKGIQATQSTTFTINVTGISSAALALIILGPLATVASTSYTAYKLRYLFWNTFKKSQYRKPAETAFIGKPYEHKLSLPGKEIATIEALLNGKKFSTGQHLSHRLYIDYKNNSIKSDCIQDDGHLGLLSIRIVDQQGFNREEFNLHIKDESEASLVAGERAARNSGDVGGNWKRVRDYTPSGELELSSINPNEVI